MRKQSIIYYQVSVHVVTDPDVDIDGNLVAQYVTPNLRHAEAWALAAVSQYADFTDTATYAVAHLTKYRSYPQVPTATNDMLDVGFVIQGTSTPIWGNLDPEVAR